MANSYETGTQRNTGASGNRPAASDTPAIPPVIDDKRTPGDQERPLTPEEELDVAVDETFPASDPVSPSRIDGPHN